MKFRIRSANCLLRLIWGRFREAFEIAFIGLFFEVFDLGLELLDLRILLGEALLRLLLLSLHASDVDADADDDDDDDGEDDDDDGDDADDDDDDDDDATGYNAYP